MKKGTGSSAIHAELQTGIESDGHIGGIIAELQCYSESSEGQNNVVKTQTHEREEGEISQARLKSGRKLDLHCWSVNRAPHSHSVGL
jgi:hypothetical protein